MPLAVTVRDTSATTVVEISDDHVATEGVRQHHWVTPGEGGAAAGGETPRCACCSVGVQQHAETLAEPAGRGGALSICTYPP